MSSEDDYNYDETCIIFDWDDTLLSSSWLAQNDLTLDSVIPVQYSDQLRELEKSVTLVLERALVCGKVIIITNSESGWVDLSCQKFIPSILPLLSRIKIISARSIFESIFSEPVDWKIHAFSDEISAVYSDKEIIRKNIISFGDSVQERIALFKVCHEHKCLNPKSIKFVERPSLEQLKRQLDLVTGNFFEICKKKNSLDLMLTIHLLQN